jgi:hypothetical protein
MATTTATITLSSSDLTSNALSLSNTMTLTQAGNDTGILNTSGLVRTRLAAANQVDLIASGAGQNYGTVTADKSAKVYIRNTGTSTSQAVRIGIGNASTGTATTAQSSAAATYWELGRLYGGEWMLIPWIATDNTSDITAFPTTSAEVYIEWMVFFE